MPHQVCHAHCPKGGGHGFVLLVAAVLIIAAIARPVVHAAEDVLQVVLITVASVIGVAVLGAAAYAALRARSRRQNRLTAVSFHPPVTRRASQAVSASRPRAIEPTRSFRTTTRSRSRGAAPPARFSDTRPVCPALYVITSEHLEEDSWPPSSSSL